MEVATVAIVMAALGVTFGWQPAKDDPQSYEVLMQVEPELVDVLQSDPGARQIPIESHVPASVTPIRNIRLLVGTDELPRTPIASATTNARATTDRVVRGQEPVPLERTANFQSDDGWSGDRYSPGTTDGSRQYDQRGATIGVEPIRTAQASPWTFDGAQQAATDAGNSLRDSVTSGIQQTNQQLSQGGQQVYDSAQNAGREFGQQLQGMTGFSGQSAAPPATAPTSGSSRSAWPAPPPLASASQATTAPPVANRTTTPAVWSSIQPQLAPPRLRTPTLTSSPRLASNPPLGSSAGPSFPPPPATSSAPPLHSVLSDSATADTANKDWSSVWGTGGTAAGANRDADASIGLEPVPPRPRSSLPAQSTSSNAAADTWGWENSPAAAPPAAATPQSNLAADAWANFGTSQKVANDPPADRYSQQFQPQVPTPGVGGAGNLPAGGPANSQMSPATIGGTPHETLQTQAANSTASAEQVPWKPLLVVSLALAASLGANFFLGISYADARQRYRSLVAKTTHAFQKEAGIAA